MAGSLTSITQQDFSGGENTVTSPYDLVQNQVQQAVNLILDEQGSLRTRDGTLIQGVQSPDPTRKIVKIYDLVKVSGATSNLAIIQGVTVNRLYNRAANPWTVLGTFSYTYATPDIITFVDSAVIAPGNQDQIRTYDGTTFSVPTPNAPSASHIALHLGYIWAWNTSPTTTLTAGPSSLQASDINVVNSWPAASQTFISKDDGTSGQGLGVFTIAEAGISPTVTIIAFKNFSSYEVSGTFAGSNLSVQKIKSDMGCVAPRSIQFVSGFGIIRLSHRGFALYDGVNDTLISEEERPRIFGRDTYSGLDWTNIGLSMASQVPNPPLYLCACPVAGGNGALTRVFVYDLVRKAWTILTFTNDLATIQLPLDPGTLPTMLGGDASTGYVRRYFAGDTTDDGTPITATVRTRTFTSGDPTDRSYFRRWLLQTAGMQNGTNVTGTFYYGPNTLIVNQTIQALTAILSQGGYGNQPYGTSPYGGAGVTALQEETLNFDILGGVIANGMFADFTWSGPGKIRSISPQLRKKPYTRSVTQVTQ